MGDTTFTTPSERDLEVTRVFDAPRELVFEVWTSCEHVPHWSGPEGWELTACEVDLRPGGSFRFVWRSPEGYDAPNGGTYEEVVAPERIVSVHPWGTEQTRNTLVLTEEDGRTTMSYRVEYPSAAIRDAALAPEMQAGMAQGYDRLETHLRTLG